MGAVRIMERTARGQNYFASRNAHFKRQSAYRGLDSGLGKTGDNAKHFFFWLESGAPQRQPCAGASRNKRDEKQYGSQQAHLPGDPDIDLRADQREQ